MRSGKLDKTIRIDRYSAGAPDAFGTSTAGWAALATMRAQIVQQSTDEFIKSGATDETTIVFRTRWLDDVTTADRISYAGKIYNIKATKEIGRREGLELRGELLA